MMTLLVALLCSVMRVESYVFACTLLLCVATCSLLVWYCLAAVCAELDVDLHVPSLIVMYTTGLPQVKIQHSKDTNFLASAGSEPVIPASEQPQTHALERAATGIGNRSY